MNLEELSLLNAIITVLWIMGPAYIANSVAVLTGGKYPIDQGRTLSDGNRILGDGKTWSGLLGGTLGGIMFGTILDSGDEVIIPAPYWTTYPEAVKLAGGEPVFIHPNKKDNFKISVSDLEEAKKFKNKIINLVFSIKSYGCGLFKRGIRGNI